jgi:hypothetical protein
MVSKYHQVEVEVDEAIRFQRDQTGPLKITHLASLFNVPYDRLRKQLQDNDSRTTRAPTNRRLDKEQEAALVTYLKRCEALGVHTRPRALAISAKSILRRAYTDISPPPTVSHSWTLRFL